MLYSELNYQQQSLQGVSRTFALTIPQLPNPLQIVVGNAYLLCRIADTIEDDPELDSIQKTQFSQQFIAVVKGHYSPEKFAQSLAPQLASQTLAAEKDLIRHTASVIRVTRSFDAPQQQALLRCVRIMSEGMAAFQRQRRPDGLADMQALDAYCYCVAGVVGEMLASLFCYHNPAIAIHEKTLQKLSVSFGQGLQMVNILKDIQTDQQRGVCWLPRSVFSAVGFDLKQLTKQCYQPAFDEGLEVLIATCREHLNDALRYILLIPVQETGIRRFCLWALGMAVLTLRKIDRHRRKQQGFYLAQDVKISRNSVRATILLTNSFTRSDRALQFLFQQWTRSLPGKAMSKNTIEQGASQCEQPSE
ncbi:phytoene/squalene synthase family protein [Candidatus Venteria ishoeyi]|uniref:phytoene/squalene synthase family protein n=1 Tax=Candidatus Venteria ishoeyi TaxID=1899563 RepID=UPI0025A569B4|nr:phytoene/squalene synthase family protein [Candidatus Venteria ishoeyi]MDM8548113.1 phytoene/squalene synthase family protein [Candidatus Venteria ishoeyi]